MSLIRVYIVGILLLLGSTIRAQNMLYDTLPQAEITATSLLSYDTNYIHKFHHNTFSIAPLISAPNLEFRLEPEIDSLKHKHNRYQPYLRDVVGFAMSYRAVILSLRVKGRISPEEQELYGSTQYSIIRIRLNANPLLFDFYHNTFRGFSDRNSRQYDPSRTEQDPYIKRGDINMQYTKLRVMYMFAHRKFSYRAAYRFTERQKRTKASAFITSHAYRVHTWGDSTFFNPGQQGLFGRYQNLKDLKVYSLGVGPGFAATLVHKKWFLSFGVQLVGDLQHNTAVDNRNTILSNGWRGALMGDASFSMGYNGDKFFFGILGKGDSNVISLPNVDASTSFFNAEINIGFRFNAPKIVSKVYDNSPLKYF